MWTIKDLIVGEIVSVKTKQQAISETKRRVNHHNSEWTYTHRGKHYNEHAVFIVDDDTKTITIKREGQ
jgi:hypothetical protein